MRGVAGGVLKILLTGTAALALASCGGRPSGPKTAADYLEDCRYSAWHGLDDDLAFNAAGIGASKESHDKAVAACSRLVVAAPANPEGPERLGVIYSLPASPNDRTPSNLPLAIENFQKAAGMGSAYSAYALARLALSRWPGTETLRSSDGDLYAKALNVLAEKARGGSVAAKTLTADLMLRKADWYPDAAGLEGSEALRVLRDAAATKPNFVYAYYMSLGDEGVCGKFGAGAEGAAGAPKPPPQNMLSCYRILQTIAEPGDAAANLELGMMHLVTAKAYAQQRGPNWRSDVMQELASSRRYSLLAQRESEGDAFTRSIADNMLKGIENAESAVASSGQDGLAVVVGAIVALIALGGGGNSADSSVADDADPMAQAHDWHCQTLMAHAFAGSRSAYNSAAWSGCYD